MNGYTAHERQRGGILGMVFALLFIAAGLGIGVYFAKGLFDWIGAKSWEPVQATLISVDLRSIRSSEGGTTWRVEAEYRYSWGGADYRSDRVDLHPGADSLGDYHRDLHARLDAEHRADRPVTAWVDPDDPSRSVLNRDMRWGRLAFGMMFPLVFGGFGFLLLVAMRRGARVQAELGDRQARYPDQPWMWFEPWRTPEIASESGKTMWVAIGFALFWNLVSAPVPFIVPRELSDGNYAALIALLFPLVGIGLIAWAVREVIRKRRYGDSKLRLDSVPVPLGGMLQARIDIPARLEGRELAVQFACIHRYRTGAGKNRKTREKTLWEDRQRVMTRSGDGPGRTSARIEMRLPGDRPAAREDDVDDRIVWQLEVTSEEPGVDYKTKFELPVFDVGLAGEPTDTDPEPAPLFEADDWRETGVQHGFASGGQRFYFPRLRILGGGLVTLAFALVFGGAGAFLIFAAGHAIFGGIFAMFGLLMLWAAVYMLFQRSEIVIGPDYLRWRHGVFGGWRELEAGAIKGFGIKRSGSFGRNLYFRIELERWGQDGKTAIADWVPNERAARSLAAHFAGLAGVRPAGE